MLTCDRAETEEAFERWLRTTAQHSVGNLSKADLNRYDSALSEVSDSVVIEQSDILASMVPLWTMVQGLLIFFGLG